MRQINIVLFSSGVSNNNGLLNTLKVELEVRGYQCFIWKDLFAQANDSDKIALLPMLIKKIPTFDFAVLICEGHDTAIIRRDNHIKEVSIMRDNVLFEIGLCVMALGLSRTLLLTDGTVRLPDDLTGKNNQLAIKQVKYSSNDKSSYTAAIKEASDYIEGIKIAANQLDLFIKENCQSLSPITVGAAATTACSYVGNFILRTLENICEKVVLFDSSQYIEYVNFPYDKIFMHIILPNSYDDDSPRRAAHLSQKLNLGYVPNARNRRAEFRFKLIDGELHIYDYPTTITTSYQMAKMILKIDADDSYDSNAQQRFYMKELDLFEAAVQSLMNYEFISEIIRLNYPSEEHYSRIKQLEYQIKNSVFIERKDY